MGLRDSLNLPGSLQQAGRCDKRGDFRLFSKSCSLKFVLDAGIDGVNLGESFYSTACRRKNTAMSIQTPPSSRPREISVAEPVAPALERVKQMLFKPFDLAKWITIGFCAWLADLGESGGGGGGGNFNPGNHFGGHNGQPAEKLRQFYHKASDYVMFNLDWIIPVAILLVLFVVALWLLMLWLNSRGKFMFLHCVALDKAEVAEPWSKFKNESNSLFRFRIVLGLIGMVLTLPLVVLMLLAILRMVLQGEADVAGVLTAVGFGLGLLVVEVVLAIIRKFLVDFVVPIQYLRKCTCLAAWRDFFSLLAKHPGQFVLYILFQIVLGMAIGFLVLAAVLVTCCCAGCLLLLPFIRTVLLLPVLVFKRAYPLYYLAQYGYDVFSVPPAPAG